jgi:hypothetical protein
MAPKTQATTMEIDKLSFINIKNFWTVSMAQVVEQLPSKFKGLSSSPSSERDRGRARDSLSCIKVHYQESEQNNSKHF